MLKRQFNLFVIYTGVTSSIKLCLTNEMDIRLLPNKPEHKDVL